MYNVLSVLQVVIRREDQLCFLSMAAFINIFLILLIFDSSDRVTGAICEGVEIETRKTVTCPLNKTEWDRRASEVNCDLKSNETCQPGSKLVYHCVLNQWSTGMVEVCAQTWFISGYCAMFSRDEKRIKNNFTLDCTNYNKPCPARYLSLDAYKFQSCYFITSTEKDKKKKTLYHDGNLLIIVVSVISVSVVLLLTLLLILFYRRKRILKRKEEEKNVVQKKLQSAPEIKSEPTISGKPLSEAEENDGNSKLLGYNPPFIVM